MCRTTPTILAFSWLDPMAVRDLLKIGLIGGAAFIAWEIVNGRATVTPPVGSSDTGTNTVTTAPQTGFLGLLASIESGGNPNAKNSKSSASGLYQFTKATAQALGLPWGSDATLPFGGASVSIDQQNAAAQTLVNQNASILQKAGVAISNATLYAAHFLGPSVAVKVLASAPSAALQPLIGSKAMAANGFPSTWTVANFSSWLSGKTGG